jgi:ADP-heptose:LPS heptosyltransferase
LRDFRPLLEIPDIAFYSLQVGPQAGDAADLGEHSGRVMDLSNRLADFAATAAAIERLDLTISVDTSVLHLAGALARPVWGLLSTRSDWRWMLDREDSPWYPTLRLFRQSRLDDWSELFSRVAAALAQSVPER